MKIELDLKDLIEKGFSYMDILENIVEPMYTEAFDLAKREVALKIKLMEAKARVADGTYTHDDIAVLSSALNGFALTSASAMAKAATKKIATRTITAKAITDSEIDDILSQL